MIKSVDQVDLFITSHGGNEPFEFACTLDMLRVRNLSEIVQVLVYLSPYHTRVEKNRVLSGFTRLATYSPLEEYRGESDRHILKVYV